MKSVLSIFIFLLIGISANSQNWEEVRDTPQEFKSHHTYGFSANDKGYLLTGGTDTGPSKAMFEYDPVTNTWTQLADYPGPARHYGIGDVHGDKVYVGFGADENTRLKDLWEYTPATDTWKQLSDCECEARTHPAFVAHKDKIYVGLGGGNGNLDDWWQYDIATDTWVEKAKFPGLRRHHPFQFALGDYVYVGLGHGVEIFNDWYRYDPENDIWEKMENLPGEGRVAGTQFAYGDKGYVLSGDGEDHYSMETGEFWSYDPANDKWEELPPHPGYSRWAPSSFIIGSDVYLSLGITYIFAGGSESHSSVWKYNLAEVSSTAENAIDSRLTILPNPFVERISLDIDNDVIKNVASIQIFDNAGKIVYNFIGITNEIDLAELPTGTYILQLNLKDETISKRIVKQ
jgi:N-acetylneuraminic acid mutarotase